MNPRITKLRAERGKNEAKIAELQARNKEIDAQVTELENTDIIGLVRASGMTPDQLAEAMRTIKGAPAPVTEAADEARAD